MENKLKFKKDYAGQYTAHMENREYELAWQPEARNWTLVVYEDGSIIFDDYVGTKREGINYAKSMHLQLIENRVYWDIKVNKFTLDQVRKKYDLPTHVILSMIDND